MNIKCSTLRASIALMFAAIAIPGQAQTQGEVEELRTEVNRLRAEMDALKNTGQTGKDAPLSGRIDEIELHAKDAVVTGDIPGSFRVPNSETSLRLYGYVELNAIREFEGDNSDMDYATFLPYAPLKGTAEGNRKGRTFLHARTSRFGFEASTPTEYGPLGIKIEGDFNNDPRTGNSAVSGSMANIFTQQATNSYGFRLRHAYGQVGGFLVGQTWTTFMDLDNSPETVDFNGPIGSTFIRQPQIRYTYGTQNAGAFTAALENPVSYVLRVVDIGGGEEEVVVDGFTKAPDLIGRWDKGFDWGALSARVVTLQHRLEDGSGISESRQGYGLGLSGMVKTVGDDFLTWAVTGGKGIGRYLNYIEGAIYDGQRILLEEAAGVVLGYQHVASDRWRFNAAVGAQKNFNNEYTEFARARPILSSGRFGINRKLWQAHLGTFWTPIQNVDIGAEYIAGRRTTLAGEEGDMSRINLSAKYSFH